MIDSTLLFALFIILLFIGVLASIIRSDARTMRRQIHQVAQQQSVIRQNDAVRLLCRAIHYLQPRVHAGLDYIVSDEDTGEEPHIAEWMHPSIPQPTSEELEAAMHEIARIDPVRDHAKQRLKEYPSIGDQLDAAYKARTGDTADQDRLDELISTIKEKYPRSDEVL